MSIIILQRSRQGAEVFDDTKRQRLDELMKRRTMRQYAQSNQTSTCESFKGRRFIFTFRKDALQNIEKANVNN